MTSLEREQRNVMRSVCLVLGLACLFACGAAPAADRARGNVTAGSADDQVERAAIGKRVDALLRAGDFAALNRMAAQFRTTRARTPSGVWKLRVFHMSVRQYFADNQPAGECTSIAGPVLERWLAADPSAPAPAITKASVLLEQAWCKRHDDAWGYNSFLADASEADRWLAAHKSSASIDPEYYATAEDVGFVTRRDKASFEQLLAEGIAREPGYYGLYFSAIKYYLPDAHGSNEEVDRIARLAADKTSATDGAGAYARAYWVYVDCGCSIWQSAVDWQLMKRSMADVAARYPADWNFVNFARIACQMGDGTEAAKYLGKLRNDNGLAWANEADREQCFNIAGIRPAQDRVSTGSASSARPR
jgi:hypothetical protein